MIISGRREGQTLIETALVLFLLLLILLGITEFSRAWYTKSSLKNAARQGARVAAVTPSANITVSTFFCEDGMACPYTADATTFGPIKNAVCCQPGVPRRPSPASTSVSLSCKNATGAILPSCSDVIGGGEVTAAITFTDPKFFVVGNSPWPWPKSLTMTTDASMRYE